MPDTASEILDITSQNERVTRPIRQGPHSTAAIKNLKELKAALDECSIDGRTAIGRELTKLRQEFLVDQGGAENCSAQQLALVDIISRELLLLDLFDNWIFNMLVATGKLVNRKKRRLHPAVLDHQRLSDSLERHLQALGWERKQKPARSLQEYVASKELK